MFIILTNLGVGDTLEKENAGAYQKTTLSILEVIQTSRLSRQKRLY